MSRIPLLGCPHTACNSTPPSIPMTLGENEVQGARPPFYSWYGPTCAHAQCTLLVRMLHPLSALRKLNVPGGAREPGDEKTASYTATQCLSMNEIKHYIATIKTHNTEYNHNNILYKQLNLITNNYNYWNESITKISLLLRGSVHHQNSSCNAEREK